MYHKITFGEKEEFVINPILNMYTILEKVKSKVIYNPNLGKYLSIRTRLSTYPIYLPEIGHLISLDITSSDLDKKFYEDTKDYDKFYSEGNIMCSSLYNFDPEQNRAVCWGNYKKFKINKNFYNLYIANIFNDFVILPSIAKRFGLYSPNRWFFIESKDQCFFRATVNYNVSVIYLSDEQIKKAKRVNIWINSPLQVFEVAAKSITYKKNGYIVDKPIMVYFLNEPSEELKVKKGDYFICFMISFNNYETNYSRFLYKNKKFNINLVESLSELVYSPYDIIPFLFRNFISIINPESFVFKFLVDKFIINKIIRRLEKFGPSQNKSLIESFESIIERKNNLLKIEDKDEDYLVKIANPSVVPYLIKRANSNIHIGIKNHIKEILGKKDILKELEEFDQVKGYKSEYKLLPILGIRNYLNYRKSLLHFYYDNYSDIDVPLG